MPNHASGNRFFINDFDNEDFDFLLLCVADSIFETQQYDSQGNRISNKNLEFWINSEGGDAGRAFALVELIALAKHKGFTVETFVLHDAFSAGSMVAVAGSEGHRWVAMNANYMVHYGTAETMTNSVISAGRVLKAHERHFLSILNYYETHCAIPDLEERLKSDDLYITAYEAVAWQMADGYMSDYPN